MNDIPWFRPEFKLLISSETLNTKKFSDYFDCALNFHFSEKQHLVNIVYTKVDYLDASIATTLQIHVIEAHRNVLIFCTSQEEIETTIEVLEYNIRDLETNMDELIIYENLLIELQA